MQYREKHEDLDKTDKMDCFRMRVLHNESTAYSRQIREAAVIMIQERKGPVVLNKKQEYTRCLVPTLGTLNHQSNLKKKKTSVEERKLISDPDEMLRLEEDERQDDKISKNIKRNNNESSDENTSTKRMKIDSNNKNTEGKREFKRVKDLKNTSEELTEKRIEKRPLRKSRIASEEKISRGNKKIKVMGIKQMLLTSYISVKMKDREERMEPTLEPAISPLHNPEISSTTDKPTTSAEDNSAAELSFRQVSAATKKRISSSHQKTSQKPLKSWGLKARTLKDYFMPGKLGTAQQSQRPDRLDKLKGKLSLD